MAETEVYVYGVVEAGGRAPSGAGVTGASLRLVEGEGMAALVSDVPPGPLTPSRDDLMAHAEVLRLAAEEAVVLPMRFGVLMPDDEHVRQELLGGHGERLQALLAAMRGKVELELRASFDEERLMRLIVERHPDVREAREALEGRPPDATYYERISLGERVAEVIAAEREAHEAEMLGELRPLALDVRVGEPAHELDALSAAFLVERKRVPEFDQAVDGLGARLGHLLRLKYVGPLPPHSFVDLEGEIPAWA